VHPASLYEAVRASDAFPEGHREALLLRFEAAGATLTLSHVIELARFPPRQRAKGIAFLLISRRSIRALRSRLRAD
jgi:hypothetical protein